ncbi:hypothetical protein PEC18_30215 [Paucibacter sp. O1-1]|nr:hypothetical protein [Paucibacter sp. O1-1]MDA3829994.1 hypothetical protein [Paucibacter sp. O1-1]
MSHARTPLEAISQLDQELVGIAQRNSVAEQGQAVVMVVATLEPPRLYTA